MGFSFGEPIFSAVMERMGSPTDDRFQKQRTWMVNQTNQNKIETKYNPSNINIKKIMVVDNFISVLAEAKVWLLIFFLTEK